MKTSKLATLAAAAAGLFASLSAGPAAAQCIATSVPADAFTQEWKNQLNGGPNALAVFDNGQQLVVSGDRSYGLMSLLSPFAPFPTKLEDLNDVMSCPGTEKCLAVDVAGSSDGQYFMVGASGWGMGAWVFEKMGGGYAPVGNLDSDTAYVGTHTLGTRHLGIANSMIMAQRGPIATDLDTNSANFSTVLASEGVVSQTVVRSPMISTGPYLVMDGIAQVWVVNAGTIGAAVPGLLTGTKLKILNSTLGGAMNEVLTSVAAVADPTDESRLYLFTRFVNFNTNVFTFRLAQVVGSTVTQLGEFSPPGMYGQEPNSPFHPVAATAVGNEVALFGWAGDGDPANGTPPTVLRLYSFFASNFPTPVYSDFDRLRDLKAVPKMAVLADGSTVYGYLSTKDTLKVISLSCMVGQPGDAGVHTGPGDAAVTSPDGSVIGKDAGCVSGEACTSADGCQTGKMTCSGTPTCGQLVDKADGTACGTGGQCQLGACIICHDGDPCDGPDGCTTGVLSCAGGPTCTALTPKADGAACGSNKVCYQSQCVTCAGGGKCTSVDGCQTGKISCATGQPACDAPWTSEVDGTLCSSTGKCQGGVCSSCTVGATCLSENGCQRGKIACTGGAVCSDYQDVANGTACKGGVCNAGACMACVAGLPCESPDGCAAGSTSCNGGTVKCGNLTFKNNGTPCSGGVCSNGICKIPADAGAVVRRDAATVTGDDASTTSTEDTGSAARADTGGGTTTPTGCGCQSGIGTAWSALFVATGSLFLKRRRRQ
ncbi:MAG TPA: hypothetical protein VGK67_05575 [Myxococcales bacterium]